MNEKLEEKIMPAIKNNKKRGKTLTKTKYETGFHYLAPLIRFKDIGKENNKRQGYIKTEAKRQEFLKKLFRVTNPVPNYYSPECHKRSWWPNGQYIVKRRYNYTQSGLEHIYENNNVEQLKPIDTEQKVKKDSEYLKSFLEYDNVTPGNYIITI